MLLSLYCLLVEQEFVLCTLVYSRRIWLVITGLRNTAMVLSERYVDHLHHMQFVLAVLVSYVLMQ